jgi:GWxTD domain-containing protein
MQEPFFSTRSGIRYRVVAPWPVQALAAMLVLSASLGVASGQAGDADRRDARQHEESADYFKKWLDEDVVYIITDEELEVFSHLTTDEERESFIEEFWRRRDPDPNTAINEFKEEHYRRIAYANEWFKSGKAGWRTDRGRIYIIHGPPTSIETYPTGGPYHRPAWEGGGGTTTFPFEIWRYRHIDGIGEDIELEFVDSVGGGEYRLALDPDEKDALLHVPGQGLTWAEQRGLASKSGRLPPTFNTLREKDNPFRRYETYSRIQAPAKLKHAALREFVGVDVSFDTLPIQVRQDRFKLNDAEVLVPLTVEIPNRRLTFTQEAGVHVARVAVFGLVTDLSGRHIEQFEDDLVAAYQPDRLAEGLQAVSLYQKVLPLPDRGRYRVDIVVKDLKGDQVGVVQTAVAAPGYPSDKLAASSLILTSRIRQLPDTPERNEMFVLGDMKFHPNMRDEFLAGNMITAYFQVYNADLDQSTLLPDLLVKYEVKRQGTTVVELAREGESAVFSTSDRRIILIKALPVDRLAPGDYHLQVSVTDRLSNQTVELGSSFKIKPREVPAPPE